MSEALELYREILTTVPTERTVWEGDPAEVQRREDQARELGERMAAALAGNP